MDLGALETRVGMVIVDAAVVDDVIGIILLAILIGMIGTGAVPAWTDIGLLMVQVGVFFTVSALLGLWVLPRVGVFLSWMRAPHIHLTIAIVFGAAMAILSERLGMHFMIGAFVAGVLIRDRMVRSEHVNEEVEHQLNGISAAVLAPLFFASIGLAINLTAFQTALWFTIWLIAVAFFTKLVGCAIPAILMGITKKESLAVGVGMTSRGGVELVVALVALQSGLFNAPVPVPPVVSAMFSAVVSMAIISSVIAPICLRMLLGNVAARDNSNVLP